MRRNNGQRVCLLAFAVFASHFGMQPLDRESAQQKTAISSNQANQKAEPSNPQQSSQLAIDKKATNNQTLTNHQAWYCARPLRQSICPIGLWLEWASVASLPPFLRCLLSRNSPNACSATAALSKAASKRVCLLSCDATKTFGDRIAKDGVEIGKQRQHRARDLYTNIIGSSPYHSKISPNRYTLQMHRSYFVVSRHSNFIFNIPIQQLK